MLHDEDWLDVNMHPSEWDEEAVEMCKLYAEHMTANLATKIADLELDVQTLTGLMYDIGFVPDGCMPLPNPQEQSE